MKQISSLLMVATVLMACNNAKNIYSSNDINDRQLEKLVKSYLRNSADTAAAGKVAYAYEWLHTEKLNRIDRLRQSSDINDLEQLVKGYNDLQTFYDQANQYPAVRNLVKPGNVNQQKQEAISNAAAGWYDYAHQLLTENNWKAGREAIQVLRKVDNWLPNYQNTRQMMADATEMGTIDAVIEPLRSEGFFYSSGYTQTGSRFSRQLVTDLDNRWNNPNLYRVYEAREARYSKVEADWLIEPVITRLQIDPVNYSKSTRTATKTIEAGRDSVKNPIYKTITAVLTITEASICTNTALEARISDLQNNNRIARRSFSDNFTLREVSATFTGDQNALSAEDWKLVNNSKNIVIDERWLQEKLLEQIYPELLNYLKSTLR